MTLVIQASRQPQKPVQAVDRNALTGRAAKQDHSSSLAGNGVEASAFKRVGSTAPSTPARPNKGDSFKSADSAQRL